MPDERELIRCEYLVLRCRRRDGEAAAQLADMFQRPLLYYLRRLTGSEDDAWEISQETWMSIFPSLHRLRDPRALPAYLFRTARNHALRRLQRRQAHEELFDDRELPDCESASEEVFAAEDAASIHRALDRLTLAHREVLTLHFLEDFSIDEIAGVLAIPPGTVKSRLHYAKKSLRALLEQGGER